MSAVEAFISLQTQENRRLPAILPEWSSAQMLDASEKIIERMDQAAADLGRWIYSYSTENALGEEHVAKNLEGIGDDNNLVAHEMHAAVHPTTNFDAWQVADSDCEVVQECRTSCLTRFAALAIVDKADACKGNSAIEDLSTAIGSDTSSSADCSEHGENAEPLTFPGAEEGAHGFIEDDEQDEEEEGTDEENEFSLDGRLATMKRWRAYRAKMADSIVDIDQPLVASAPYMMSSSLEDSSEDEEQHETQAFGSIDNCEGSGRDCQATVPCRPPGLMSHCPPGLNACEPQSRVSICPESISFMKVEAKRLVEAPVPWLEREIRCLSMEALGEDIWDVLAKPLPEDPDWQLLALMSAGRLVGFCTYAFFDDEVGCVMSVHHLAIAMNCRGSGCGRRLITSLQQRAQADNAWAIKLHSKPEAIGFYERMGFSLVGPNDLMELHLLPATDVDTSV